MNKLTIEALIALCEEDGRIISHADAVMLREELRELREALERLKEVEKP